MNKFFGVLTLHFSLACPVVLAQAQEVSQQQAIQVAEVFIQQNGYTFNPAKASAFQYELFDAEEKDVRAILNARRNSLHPKAFCIIERPDSWHVGFLSTSERLLSLNASQRQADLAGRVVVVSKHKKEVSMAHKEPLFSNFKKL
ncbi:hypothetical protein [Hymenobacter metallicola]|uniref:Uncharacterized protein n=1 Tax=Hymenobacter metallicola TaxID=2563114 RepID=A0A4Z0Q0W5_9BACT|nr:hypothetical protein [Hymenobacter metallicola]TGE23607.1 hypothetical protein E5K02_20705 [Hymenobacter metallicola]